MEAPASKGVNQVSVDAKGRMAMPSRYRQALREYCGGQLITTGSHDRCLLLYPSACWPEIESQLVNLPNANNQVRSLQRLMLGYATECTMDANGRFLLPPMLREFANIDRQTVLLGQGKKFELWDSQGWERQLDCLLKKQGDTKDVHEALGKIRL